MTGGKREGAGRKPSSDPKIVTFKIRLTPTEHQKLLRLGGSAWFRNLLEKANDPNQSVRTPARTTN